MNEPQKEVVETQEELIERLLAKAELDYKCCGAHSPAVPYEAGVERGHE